MNTDTHAVGGDVVHMARVTKQMSLPLLTLLQVRVVVNSNMGKRTERAVVEIYLVHR